MQRKRQLDVVSGEVRAQQRRDTARMQQDREHKRRDDAKNSTALEAIPEM
jgi:hypothetical protein